MVSQNFDLLIQHFEIKTQNNDKKSTFCLRILIVVSHNLDLRHIFDFVI